MDFEFGSLKEAIAILAFTRARNISFMGPLFPIVGQENAQKSLNQFKSIVFPEDSINDAFYLKKAKDMMKKLITTDIRIKPTDTHGERDFKRL